MSKKIKITISIFSLVLVAVSSLIIFDLLRANQIEKNTSLESKPTESSFSDPGKKYLAFTLPSDYFIESKYDGVVDRVFKNIKSFEDIGDNTEVQIIFIRVNENFSVQYTIVGELLVDTDDVIRKGSIIAKIKDGGLKAYEGANVVIDAFDSDYNIISLLE